MLFIKEREINFAGVRRMFKVACVPCVRRMFTVACVPYVRRMFSCVLLVTFVGGPKLNKLLDKDCFSSFDSSRFHEDGAL